RVEKYFKNSVMEREKMAYTSFNTGYAIPHAIDFSAIKSTISIALLKRPIKWGEYSIKIVFLLAVRKEESHLLKVFFDWLSSLNDEPDVLLSLNDAHTASDFVKMFNKQRDI
ncbi:MAG: PTS sugar transporter subunit IIA, partial [Erysipelotrichaceae bacterium]